MNSPFRKGRLALSFALAASAGFCAETVSAQSFPAPSRSNPFSLKATPILPPPANTLTDQVAVAALRRGGPPDLITTSSSGTGSLNLLSVRLSNGRGGYAPPVNYPLTGLYSSTIVVADFTGDGIPDILVGSNDTDASLQVFPGKGDGTFRAPLNTTSLQQAFSVAAGDFNGDGKLDIAVTGLQTTGVMVALGRGDGTFRAPVFYDTADVSTLWQIQAADLNRDGKLDLVVARQNGDVTVLPGLGGGRFAEAKRTLIADDTRVTRVFVADLNGDGKPDIVAGGDFGSGSGTSVLLGKGDLTFRTPVKVDALSVNSVADLNRDGKPDLVTTSGGARHILLGNGNGTYHRSALFYGQSGGSVAADVNGDGKVDLLAPSFGVAITYGYGDGTFAASGTVFSGASSSAAPYAVALADLNGDGKLDMAVANAQESTVTVFAGDGAGGFTSLGELPVGFAPVSIIAVDLNRDGKRDLVVVDEFGNDLTLLFGNGDGTFKAPVSLSTGSTPMGVVSGDFNRDGIPDLAVANGGSNTVSVFLGLGDGTFRAPISLSVGSFPSGITAADFNGDGIPDLATANQGSNSVSVAFGKGDGTFRTASSFSVGKTPFSVASGDLNGDGKPDLVTANNGDSTVSVLFNSGAGRFGTAQPLRVGSVKTDPSFVVVADLNGDGDLDILTANDTDQSLSVLLNRGKGVFAPSQEFFGGSGPVGLAVGNVNGDKLPDILVANRFESDVSILLNTTLKLLLSELAE